MKKANIFLLTFQLCSIFSFSQITKTYDSLLSQYKELPTISISEAQKLEKKAIFIDTREYKEFKVSHIPNALFLGYNKPNWIILNNIPKTKLLLFIAQLVQEVKI